MHEHRGLLGVAASTAGGIESWLHLLDGIAHTLIQFGTLLVILLTSIYYWLKIKHKLWENRNDK